MADMIRVVDGDADAWPLGFSPLIRPCVREGGKWRAGTINDLVAAGRETWRDSRKREKREGKGVKA